MTAAQRAAMDINEDAKGAPVHLTPCVFFIAVFIFSFPHHHYCVISLSLSCNIIFCWLISWHCRVERALEAAGPSVAPPERTARSGTDSVLPPKPTVSSSRVRVNREPACSEMGGVDSDEDGNGDKAERRGKNVDRDGDDLDELDVDHECEGESDNEDVDMYEEKRCPHYAFWSTESSKRSIWLRQSQVCCSP